MIWSALYVSGVLLAAHGANQNPDAVRAHALIDEGRRLMAAGDYANACPKFASSKALDPAPSTDLALASCYEKAGKLASAWDAFRAAAAGSGAKGHAASAKKKAAAIESKLSRLTIAVAPSAQITGLEVRCQDEPVQALQWGVAVPRDGGEYEIQAAAPGKKTWSTRVELRPSKQSLVVDVPALEDAPPAPSAQTVASGEPAPADAVSEAPSADGEHPGRTQRLVGLIVGGTGIVGVGVGGVVALMAKSQMNAAQNEANPASHSDSVSALNTGNLATVVVGIGAAAAVAGAIVWFTAPDAPVTVGTSGSALLIGGRF
jgi:hypothetical protein